MKIKTGLWLLLIVIILNTGCKPDSPKLKEDRHFEIQVNDYSILNHSKYKDKKKFDNIIELKESPYSVKHGNKNDHNGTLNSYSKLSISLDGKIYLLSSYGHLYKTSGIDSVWTSLNSLPRQNPNSDQRYNQTYCTDITFCTDNIALVTGRLAVNEGFGIYRTEDNCKSWEYLELSGEEELFAIHITENRRIWLGGSSGKIYYSDDLGETFDIIENKTIADQWVMSIYMTDKSNGVLATTENFYSTTDNWKTAELISPRPYGQRKNELKTNLLYPGNYKIAVWKDYVIARTAKGILSKTINTITGDCTWEEFPEKIEDFSICDNSGKLYGICRDEGLFRFPDQIYIVEYSSPTECNSIKKIVDSEYIKDIEVCSDELYILDNSGLMEITSEKKIPSQMILKGKTIDPYNRNIRISDAGIKYGSDHNNLYCFDEAVNDWYRVCATTFNINSFKILSDKQIALSDGSNYYLYSPDKDYLEDYTYEKPLTDFLKFPVTSMKIKGEYHGCWDEIISYIEFKREDGKLISVKYTNNKHKSDSIIEFKHQIETETLNNVLHSINKEPDNISEPRDFNFTQEHIDCYLKFVRENDYMCIPEDFYCKVPSILDTVNSDLFKHILSYFRESPVNNHPLNLKIVIFNQVDDSIEIKAAINDSDIAWGFPWSIEYNSMRFLNLDIELSRFINSCLPDDFPSKQFAEFNYLFKEIGDYFNWVNGVSEKYFKKLKDEEANR